MKMKPCPFLALTLAIGAACARSQTPQTPPAQTAPPAPAAAPMSMPSMTGPISANPKPASFDAGPLGTVFVTGAVTGFAQFQDNTVPGDRDHLADLANAQVFIQKTSGVFQFYVQAGEYSTPDLGLPYVRSDTATSALFGPIPQVFVKLQLSDSFSIQAGKLPTLVGAEFTWSFENMNIERGLLWGQENAVNRGVQANFSAGSFSFSAAVSDGMYSNRYGWLSFNAVDAIDASDSLSFVAAGNTRYTDFSTSTTPLYLNNEQIYNLIYTHTSGPWVIQPYLQYSRVPMKRSIGALHEASTSGAALLVSYKFADGSGLAGFSLPFRVEYISSTGTLTDGSPNLLYGPGSSAWSATVTPTYQKGVFFARAELSIVGVSGAAPGGAFGDLGDATTQTRLALETGFVF
jgi:hypothetical protein